MPFLLHHLCHGGYALRHLHFPLNLHNPNPARHPSQISPETTPLFHFIPIKTHKEEDHLRPKILKTLTKPFPAAPLPQIEATPLHKDTAYETPLKEILSSEELEVDKVEEFNVSETVSSAGEYSDTVGKERNFNEKWNVLSDVNGNEVYVSESELEEKISEIKVMAREARERERRELIQGDKGSELEKEIGARLVKLEKRLNSKSEKLQDSFTEYLGLFGDFRDGSDSKEENKTLMFKKKFRFKSPSMDARSTPKCFSGLKDDSGVRKSGTDLNGLSRKTDVRSLKKDTGRKDGNVQLNSVKNNGNKVEKKGANLRKESGSVHEIREGRPSNEDPEAGKSRDLETLNSESSTKENQETSIKAERPAATSSRNGSRDPGKRQLAYKFGDKQSDVQKDLWWSNLPYVLSYPYAVPSQADKHGDFSYTIAFEDRGNADNFCYLLESVFEDLGDFSADIVPLQVKELHDAVKLHSKKVIVVKKGHLKLYAGQPFSEVEMALYSLFEQD
ncbi:hypothetical protein OIU84_021871 [Salix udensis]|uniref:Uncharacterized protein n=1 Tax=Salix udensis TaxID=889485 RepID=A0AAD6PHX9_9ROSI|nr:hypothetical protein OIU84_021871 [Salix udensis]